MPDDANDVVIIGPGMDAAQGSWKGFVPEQCHECGDAIIPGINDTNDGPFNMCNGCYIPPCGCPEYGPAAGAAPEDYIA